jgi:cytochrome P450
MSINSGLPSEDKQPFDWLDHMRETQAVFHDEKTDSWHIFSHGNVTRIFSEPALFSSDQKPLFPLPPGLDVFSSDSFIRMDSPRHEELRRLVSKAFTPRMVAGLEPRIRQIAGELLDIVQDEAELVTGLTYPRPIIVIAELLGVPIEDRDQFRTWTDVMLNGSTSPDEVIVNDDMLRGYAPTMREMFDYFLEKVREHRADPSDDLISGLVNAEIDGERLDDDQIAGFAIVMLIYGSMTTTALLGATVLILDERPTSPPNCAPTDQRSLAPSRRRRGPVLRSPGTYGVRPRMSTSAARPSRPKGR